MAGGENVNVCLDNNKQTKKQATNLHVAVAFFLLFLTFLCYFYSYIYITRNCQVQKHTYTHTLASLHLPGSLMRSTLSTSLPPPCCFHPAVPEALIKTFACLHVAELSEFPSGI